MMGRKRQCLGLAVLRSADHPGMTLVELLVAVSIVGTLAGIAIPMYARARDKAMVVRAIADISVIQGQLAIYHLDHDALPTSLSQLSMPYTDPWGHPYSYLNFAGVKGKGSMRKDRFLVPLNSDYDLYSMGQDGESKMPLTAKQSRDDIIRANDGAFIGLASDF
jgi:general secretion pathway protein G